MKTFDLLINSKQIAKRWSNFIKNAKKKIEKDKVKALKLKVAKQKSSSLENYELSALISNSNASLSSTPFEIRYASAFAI